MQVMSGHWVPQGKTAQGKDEVERAGGRGGAPAPRVLWVPILPTANLCRFTCCNTAGGGCLPPASPFNSCFQFAVLA